MNHRRGFTLIELLVVISVIGLITTLALVAINNARVKARDAKRRGDARQLMNALELYRANNNAIMNCGFVSSCGSGMAPGTCFGIAMAPYISRIPTDPKEDVDNDYCYFVCTEGSGCNTTYPDPNRYYIRVKLESTADYEDTLISK